MWAEKVHRDQRADALPATAEPASRRRVLDAHAQGPGELKGQGRRGSGPVRGLIARPEPPLWALRLAGIGAESGGVDAFGSKGVA